MYSSRIRSVNEIIGDMGLFLQHAGTGDTWLSSVLSSTRCVAGFVKAYKLLIWVMVYLYS